MIKFTFANRGNKENEITEIANGFNIPIHINYKTGGFNKSAGAQFPLIDQVPPLTVVQNTTQADGI